jgi:hypothetical protein
MFADSDGTGAKRDGGIAPTAPEMPSTAMSSFSDAVCPALPNGDRNTSSSASPMSGEAENVPSDLKV